MAAKVDFAHSCLIPGLKEFVDHQFEPSLCKIFP
jgi:hypothetical protein